MAERRPTAKQTLQEIDEIVQFWRDDEVDGATYTLVQVDQILGRYLGRPVENFPEDMQP